MSRFTALLLVFFLCISLSACGEATVPQSTYDELKADYSELQSNYSELQSVNNDLQEEIASLTKQIEEANTTISSLENDVVEFESTVSSLNEKIDDLENGPAALIVSIRNASENEDWEQVVALAEDLHTRANGSPEDVEGQKLATAAKKAIDKAEAEAAAAKAKEYDTGITYDQLARNPEDYKNQKVKFSGRVLQSFVDGSNTVIMMHPNGNTSLALYITIASSSLESRVLEGDWITVRGISNGLYTYNSAGGMVLSVPWIKADTIER